jgi:hypothetical protein
MCEPHANELRESRKEQRAKILAGFPIRGRDPCRPFPDDATYKTVALSKCPNCDTYDCWEHYLSWEKHSGISYNQREHPAIDDWEEREERARLSSDNNATSTTIEVVEAPLKTRDTE